MKMLPIKQIWKRLCDEWPGQWWRTRGHGKEGNKFHCPACNQKVPMKPFRKGILRVFPHRLRYGGKCHFSNHLEPVEPLE